MSFYEETQSIATELLGEFKQGRVTVVRTVQEEKPDDWPTWEPWEGATTTSVYELDAVVKGVSVKLVDGEVVKATDLELTCSNKMMLVEVDGVAVTPAAVPFDAGLLDTLDIDGKPVTVVRDLTVPAAGTPVAHRYVVRG